MKPLLDVGACLNGAVRPHHTLPEREGSEFKSGTTPDLIDTYKRATAVAMVPLLDLLQTICVIITRATNPFYATVVKYYSR